MPQFGFKLYEEAIVRLFIWMTCISVGLSYRHMTYRPIEPSFKLGKYLSCTNDIDLW